MAPVERERVGEHLEPLGLLRVARVGDPAVRLHEDSRTEVLVLVPPVRRARSRAARAQDALFRVFFDGVSDWSDLVNGERGEARTHLVHAVELEAVLLGLEVLPSVGRDRRLEVRLDRLVLLVEPARVPTANGSLVSTSPGILGHERDRVHALGHVRDEVLDDIHCEFAWAGSVSHGHTTDHSEKGVKRNALCGRG